jgi:AcrR family transcriptional regulator
MTLADFGAIGTMFLMPVPKGESLDPARTRATIIEAATRLLYVDGLDGIGVAGLCASIGMSKETLYRHFGSKEGLVEAVLEARSERVLRWLDDAVARSSDDPASQLAAIFDALGQWYAEPGFRGCAVMNAVTQQRVARLRPIAARHLDRLLSIFADIAARAGAADPAGLARQLLTLMEGATVLADHHGDVHAAETAKTAANSLLAASTTA